MLTNYTLRCPSIGERSGEAAESIFFTCEDRAAAGCSSDSGQLWVPLHFPGSAKLSSSFFFFFLPYEYIYIEEFRGVFFKNPIIILVPPVVGGGPRGEDPADNLEIARASFELPWQIHPSLNPKPHSRSLRDAISILCFAASSLICLRSCLGSSSAISLPTTSSTEIW